MLRQENQTDTQIPAISSKAIEKNPPYQAPNQNENNCTILRFLQNIQYLNFT
jgi:hypothetical protein